MQLPKTYLRSRITWLLFFWLVGIASFLSIEQEPVGRSISATGMMVFGVVCFLAPLPLGKPESSMIESINTARHGSDRLRTVLAAVAMTALFVGLVLRYGFGI